MSLQTAEGRIREEHSDEVEILQRELDLARGRLPDLERQLLEARCEMDELEQSARSVHRSLQVQ